jgi:formate dehydrogenase gamma subunit
MGFLTSAKSFFDNVALPQQVSWALGLLLISLVAVMAGWVLIRRSYGKPVHSTEGVAPPAGKTFERYELMARFWHWSLFGMFLALLISGLAFYDPDILHGPAPIIGIAWLWVHLFFGALFVVGVLGHSLHGVFSELNSRVVWFSGRDWVELKAKLRYYLGRGREVPRTGKFSAGNKVFHMSLAILAFLMVVTGIILSLDTLGWVEINQDLHRQQRIVHDIGSWGFVTLLVAHIFWQLLRGNLRTMLTGSISSERLKQEFDWEQWQPEVHGEVLGKVPVDPLAKQENPPPGSETLR